MGELDDSVQPIQLENFSGLREKSDNAQALPSPLRAEESEPQERYGGAIDIGRVREIKQDARGRTAQGVVERAA